MAGCGATLPLSTMRRAPCCNWSTKLRAPGPGCRGTGTDLQCRQQSSGRADPCGCNSGAGIGPRGNQGDTADAARRLTETFADVEELLRDTGFRPQTLIEDGLADFVAWYRDFYGISGSIPSP